MKRIRVATVCAMALLCALLASAPSALAAQAAPAVVTPEETQIQVWPTEPTGVDLIVTALIASDTPLPAVVRIPVPEGATVQWSGEIADPTGANDIQRPFTLEDGVGGKVAVVRAEKYREVQVEASLGQPQPAGDRLTYTLRWVQSAPGGAIVFAVKTVASAIDVQVQPAPGTPVRGTAGETLYPFQPQQLKAGAKLAITTSFKRSEVTTGTAGAGGGSSTLLTVLILLLVIAVIALLVFAARSFSERSRARAERDAEASEPRDEEEPAPDEDADDDSFDIDWR